MKPFLFYLNKSAVTLAVLILFILSAGFLRIAVLDTPQSNCALPASFLDPVGMLGIYWEVVFPEDSRGTSGGSLQTPNVCSLRADDFIWPLFYLLADLAFALIVFLTFRILFKKAIISAPMYRLGFTFFFLSIGYLILIPLVLFFLLFIHSAFLY